MPLHTLSPHMADVLSDDRGTEVAALFESDHLLCFDYVCEVDV
jgi:hypothetical protein